ncbi:LysM peptidoglycan-binding domain-containing protein [bacterium]|nr:LysM peptidoglycan-binding domain-containing protein [candidate division CSSED10-310 bacterium]
MKLFKSITLVLLGIAVVGLIAVESNWVHAKSWTYDGVEYKLPRPMEEIQIPENLPEYHDVVPGDCLWFISKQYLNDPFLWPLIWEENLDTIQNPHLIFPGQKVKLPGGTIVTTGEVITPISTEPSEATELDQEAEFAEELTDEASQKRIKPYPVTSETNIIASGYIAKDIKEGPKVVGANTESFDLSSRDIVYLDGGSDKGLEPDQDLFVLRKMHKVVHPITGKNLGWMIHVVAEAKTLCINDDNASAILGTSYHPVLRGDFVVPKEEIPIPVTLGSPSTDPCNPSTKQLPGTIVDAFIGGPEFSDAVVLAKNDIAYIDLGKADGVAPGDYFTIFKRNLGDANLPRYVSGEAMVVKVAETTSTVVITQSQTAIFIGDQIELKQ